VFVGSVLRPNTRLRVGDRVSFAVVPDSQIGSGRSTLMCAVSERHTLIPVFSDGKACDWMLVITSPKQKCSDLFLQNPQYLVGLAVCGAFGRCD
jgi:hypothetical protein